MLEIPISAESDLAYRVQAHDEAAFELLYASYSDAIFRYLGSMVLSEPAAQDLAQKVFLRLWTRADQ